MTEITIPAGLDTALARAAAVVAVRPSLGLQGVVRLQSEGHITLHLRRCVWICSQIVDKDGHLCPEVITS